MTSKAYTILGWLVWQLARRVISANRTKVGAAGLVGLVLVGGVVAAKVASGDD
jgi:hypothetical protein